LGYDTARSGNFLPKFWDNLLAPSLREGLVKNYHCSLHNKAEEHSSHLLCGGSLKLHMATTCSVYTKEKWVYINLQCLGWCLNFSTGFFENVLFHHKKKKS